MPGIASPYSQGEQGSSGISRAQGGCLVLVCKWLAKLGLELGGLALACTALITVLSWPQGSSVFQDPGVRGSWQTAAESLHFGGGVGVEGAVGHPETMWGAEG